jgi:ketosteroid isomerase-like protein
MIDTKDWAGFGRLVTDDFVLDMDGPPPLRGREAVLSAVGPAIATARTAHQVHLPEIEVDGDEATAIFPMQDRVVWDDGRSLTGYGHYHERYVRQGGGWRLAATKLTRLYVDFNKTPAPQAVD